MPGDAVVVENLRPDVYSRALATSRSERDGRLPALSDPYQAAGTPDNAEVSRLVVIMGKNGFKPGATAYYLLQYVHLSWGEFGFDADGQWFSYVFADIQPKKLTAHGRGILRYADYIALHRLPWIRMADRDFRAGDGAESDEPIFTRIEVTDWEKPKPED
jgi:hypothetical protein